MITNTSQSRGRGVKYHALILIIAVLFMVAVLSGKSEYYKCKVMPLLNVFTVALGCTLPLSVYAHGNAEHERPWGDSAGLHRTYRENIVTRESSIDGDVQDVWGDYSSATESTVIQQPATPLMSPALGGSWSPVYDWPLVAVHAALLPNGKVLAWDATPDDADDDPHTTDNFTTRVTLWDPSDNTHIATNNDTDTDLFCAGSAHLWDGRILFAGGDGAPAGANGPLANSNIYDSVTNTWRRTENMNAPRWYSSVAALSNGEMLTFGGSYQNELMAEVFGFDKRWRALTTVTPDPAGAWWLQTVSGSSDISYDYQWLQAAPDGSVVFFGPQNLVARLDTAGTGSWTEGPQRDQEALRDYGSYAMFDIGKILVAGGGQSVASSVIIDTNTQQTIDSGSMHSGRRQHNLTILADGSVLATGGNSDGTSLYSPTAGVFTPELWDSATGQFRELNPMQGDRQYHSIALLLSDGRLLSAGGGICGDCYRAGYEERNAEIFTPPYLYAADSNLAPRPALEGVPATANYAQAFSVTTGAGVTIERAHLIKPGSATHSQNQDQRLIPLEFQQNGADIRFMMPASRHSTPPGHYLLFIIDTAGVPSLGSMIKIGQPLVAVGERVVSTLDAGGMDHFAYELQAGVLQADVTADAPIRFYVSQDPPQGTVIPDEVLCRSETPDSATQNCELNVPSAATWYLSIAAQARANYQIKTLLATPVNDSGVDQTPADPLPEEPAQVPTEPTTQTPAQPVTEPMTEPVTEPMTEPSTQAAVSTGGALSAGALTLLLVFTGWCRTCRRNSRVRCIKSHRWLAVVGA